VKYMIAVLTGIHNNDIPCITFYQVPISLAPSGKILRLNLHIPSSFI
jgi:hypothetical protein